MNIYLVERTDRIGYDEYDSFVCYAESEEQAKSVKWIGKDPLIVTYLGTATASTPIKEATVILASFNAG